MLIAKPHDAAREWRRLRSMDTRNKLTVNTASDVVSPSIVGDSIWNRLMGSNRIAATHGVGGINLKATPSNTKQANKVKPLARS